MKTSTTTSTKLKRSTPMHAKQHTEIEHQTRWLRLQISTPEAPASIAPNSQPYSATNKPPNELPSP